MAPLIRSHMALTTSVYMPIPILFSDQKIKCYLPLEAIKAGIKLLLRGFAVHRYGCGIYSYRGRRFFVQHVDTPRHYMICFIN